MESQLEKLKKDTSSAFLFVTGMPVLRIGQEIQDVHTPSEFIIIEDNIPMWSELLRVKVGSVPACGHLISFQREALSFHFIVNLMVQSDIFNHSFKDENPLIYFSLISSSAIVQRGSRLDFIILFLSDVQFNLCSS